MKRLLLFVFIVVSMRGLSQNVASLSFAPAERGYGMRYERIIKKSGLYVSYLQGKYKTDLLTMDHKRLSYGLTHNNLMLGIVHHNYRNTGDLNKRTVCPVSFEIGGRGVVGWFVAGIRFDFIKHEGIFDIGICF